MTIITASTAFKKQDGTLSFDSSKNSVSWEAHAAAASPSSITIAVSDIINLQQTPANNPKVALRLVVQPSTSTSPENFTFNFQAPSRARSEQEAITDALRDAITKAKKQAIPATNTSTPVNEQAPLGSEGQSAAMAIAAAVTSGAASATADNWYDDQKLKSNVDLQQSLLVKDPALRQRFEESLREKPESIKIVQFSQQFWSTRLHLLRAHAIEKNQSHGMYNVLAEVKPKIVDGTTRLNLSKEQIQLIFNQHPIVKHVYNEVVPKLSETEFWSRFFVSKLFKQLKGERITDADSNDAVLDRYLNTHEEKLRNQQMAESQIPHFMDLEGNEQNHSQQQGNRPDFTMRPTGLDKVPILRVLNNMSERMLSAVAPADGDITTSGTALDDTTFNELRLRDLQAESEEDRIILNIRNQSRLFGGAGGHSSRSGDESGAGFGHHERLGSGNGQLHAPPAPTEVLSSVCTDLHRPFDLESALVDRGSLSKTGGKEDNEEDQARAGSSSVGIFIESSTITASINHIFSLVKQQRQLLHSSANESTLSANALQALKLTHSTTTEFLHYFWSLLLASGPTHMHRELPALLTTLVNSLSRIMAVADTAEKERQARLDELKRQAAEYTRRTGKRRRVDEAAVNVGGKHEVEMLMGPTIRAIGVARDKYHALQAHGADQTRQPHRSRITAEAPTT